MIIVIGICVQKKKKNWLTLTVVNDAKYYVFA